MNLQRGGKALMEAKTTGRRRFLTVLGSTVPVCCLAGSGVLRATEGEAGAAAGQAGPGQGAEAPKHKFQDKSEMTYEQVYHFAFSDGYIATLTALAKKIDKENYLEVLKQVSSETSAEGIKKRKTPDPSLENFMGFLRKPNEFWKHVVSFEIVEDTETVFELKVKECLWATTFRARNAGEVGYACICHPDFAVARAYNPKMRMERSKTLMQGHDCCNHRYVMDKA